MKASEAIGVLIDGLFANTHGKAFGWHGETVAGNMTGLREATLEEQVEFIQEMLNRGVDRVIAERISNASVKTVEQALQRASYVDLKDYQRGSRVGGTRLNTVNDCAKAYWYKNFKLRMDDNSEAAKDIAAKYGLSIVEVVSEGGRKLKKIEGIENPEFVTYLEARILEDDLQKAGLEMLKEIQAAREAKKATKKGDAAL